LSIGQQRGLLEVLELDFEHIRPGTLCREVIREWIVSEWPGVAFTPEAVREGVNNFDERVAIEFRCQLANQFFECLLKKRMIKPG
jgi:hypothetical protein